MKKFVIDRFEGDKAVLECENGEQAVLERTSLPKNINVGDVLQFQEGSCFLNEEETERRRSSIKAMMEKLFTE